MQFTCVSTGRIVCWRSYFLPHRQSSEFATRSSARIVILSATIGRDARPDLTANRVCRPAGLCPIHPPTTFPRVPPLGFKHPSERLLARRSRMQPVCSSLCHSRSTLGPILYGGLPAVRPSSEASAVSTIFFRGRSFNPGDSGDSPFVDSYLPSPIFSRPERFPAQSQQNHWPHHDRSRLLLLWVVPHLRHDGTALEIAIATPVPDFVVDILLDAEIPPTFSQRPLSQQESYAHELGSISRMAGDERGRWTQRP